MLNLRSCLMLRPDLQDCFSFTLSDFELPNFASHPIVTNFVAREFSGSSINASKIQLLGVQIEGWWDVLSWVSLNFCSLSILEISGIDCQYKLTFCFLQVDQHEFISGCVELLMEQRFSGFCVHKSHSIAENRNNF
jgi:hypothetical protein